MLAAFDGYEEMVKLLLKQETVDINSHDMRGITSLAYAAAHGHDRVVKLLLEMEDIIPNWRDNE